MGQARTEREQLIYILLLSLCFQLLCLLFYYYCNDLLDNHNFTLGHFILSTKNTHYITPLHACLWIRANMKVIRLKEYYKYHLWCGNAKHDRSLLMFLRKVTSYSFTGVDYANKQYAGSEELGRNSKSSNYKWPERFYDNIYLHLTQFTS
jgi:hypothetical protein